MQALPVKPHTHNAKVQTTEPVVGRGEVEGLRTQLEDTAARLQESERTVLVSYPLSVFLLSTLVLPPSLPHSSPLQELRGVVTDREGKIKELEVEVLTASQKLAAGAGVHAHQMSEQAAQLDRCKVCNTELLYFRGCLG